MLYPTDSVFKIYVEYALKTWKYKCRTVGYKIYNTTLYTLQFEDNKAVMGKFKDDKYMTRKLSEEDSEWGLEMNINKTKHVGLYII